MLEIKHTWTSTGSSGGLEPVLLRGGAVESVMSVAHGALATTNSVSFQTAQSSAGPWFTEGSTSISTSGAGQVKLRVTGPFEWARPYFHTDSTGEYTIRLVAVS